MANLPETAAYTKGRLHFGGQSTAVLADLYRTPLIVYCEEALEKAVARLPTGRAGVRICHRIRNNGNLEVLSKLADLNLYFEISSLDDLGRLVAAVQSTKVLRRCVATGPAKCSAFIKTCLIYDVFSIHAESEAELARIASIREQDAPNSQTRVALRVNPDLSEEVGQEMTASSTARFGVSPQEVLRLADRYPVHGIYCHTGSAPLTKQSLAKTRESIQRLLNLLEQRIDAKEIEFADLDCSSSTQSDENGQALVDSLAASLANRDLQVIIRPLRPVSSQATLLLTKVEHTKVTGTRQFAFVDSPLGEYISRSPGAAHHCQIFPEAEPPPATSPTSTGNSTTSASSLTAPYKLPLTNGHPMGHSPDLPADRRTSTIERRKAEGVRLPSLSPEDDHRPMPSPRLSRRLLNSSRDEDNRTEPARMEAVPADLRGSRESLDDRLLSEMQGSRLFKKQQALPTPSPRTSRRPSAGEAAVLAYEVVGHDEEFRDGPCIRRLLPTLRGGDVLGIFGLGGCGPSAYSQPAQVFINKDGTVQLVGRRELLSDRLFLERNLESFQMHPESKSNHR